MATAKRSCNLRCRSSRGTAGCRGDSRSDDARPRFHGHADATTSTPILVPVKPVIPQVFQNVPQGIFNGTRNNTPTPVRPAAAAVAPASSAPIGAMPQLRPPSTGDAGLRPTQE